MIHCEQTVDQDLRKSHQLKTSKREVATCSVATNSQNWREKHNDTLQ